MMNSNEIKIMINLEHEFLIGFYDYFHEKTNLCILMELCEVCTLKF